MKDTVMRIYDIAREKDWRPWDLQTELRKVYEGVIAVGDDLSFTLRFEKDLKQVDMEKFGGRKTRLHPFKNAYRFEKGFIAYEGKFLRISREVDKKLLSEILNAILPED